VSLLPVLIAIHVALAIALFLPSILLPFALRAQRAATDSGNRVVQLLLDLQSRGTLILGAGLALTGVSLVVVLGSSLVSQPWLLLALAIYAANLGLAFFVQRPNLRRLVGVRAAWDDPIWHARAQRQRYVSYAMAGLVGTIGFLMTTKPVLW
jgi:hypothetical protein